MLVTRISIIWQQFQDSSIFNTRPLITDNLPSLAESLVTQGTKKTYLIHASKISQCDEATKKTYLILTSKISQCRLSITEMEFEVDSK